MYGGIQGLQKKLAQQNLSDKFKNSKLDSTINFVTSSGIISPSSQYNSDSEIELTSLL